MQSVHGGDQLVVDALAATAVRDLPVALDAQHGDQVAALVQLGEGGVVHVGAVGEDREQQVLHPARRLDDVPAQQRLAARQHDEADAQRLGLFEDGLPLLGAQLLHRLGVHGGLVAAGIAPGAVQVAGAGDAGDQEGGHVQPFLFEFEAALGRPAGGRREFDHEGALPGIAQRRLQRIRHDLLNALRDVLL